MKYIAILFFVIIVHSCKSLLDDEKLNLQKTPYSGSDLQMNGYYYEQVEGGTILFFLYTNGIKLQCYHHSTKDFAAIESELQKKDYLERLKNDKTRWGLFIVQGNQFIYEGWSTSVGGGLPMYRSEGIIENDTTLRIVRSLDSTNKFVGINWKYHFRKFSPKPDSTNHFIK